MVCVRTQFFNFFVSNTLCIFLVATASGIPQTGGISMGTYFFLKPDSKFPSGQANILELEKGIIKEHKLVNYLVERNNIHFWMDQTNLVRDLDLSLRVIDIASKKTYFLLEIHKHGAVGINETTRQREVLEFDKLSPLTDDLGLALTLTGLTLRKEPDWKASSTERVEQNERMGIEKISGDWALIYDLNLPSRKGWVELGSVITKFDFATHVLPISGKWIPAKYRVGNQLFLEDNTSIYMEKIKALITDPERGIAIKNLDPYGVVKRAHLKILKPDTEGWVESLLAGHGSVFWKKKQILEDLKMLKQDSLISTETLLQRSITSVAFHPKNPKLGIASAEGVYITQDGAVWEALDSFRNHDLPVAISDSGEFFVGPFRSNDTGKNFYPYLRWEQISKMTQSSSNKSNPVMRITRIETFEDSNVRLHLDNGLKKMRIAGNTKFGLSTKWKIE